jgi:hypothetical protein
VLGRFDFDSETADDMAKNSHLKDLQALGPLEVLRANLDEEGSFDDAVAGCDYAFLVAAPVHVMSENPEVCVGHGTKKGKKKIPIFQKIHYEAVLYH